MSSLPPSIAADLPASVTQPPAEPNIDGVVARLQFASGGVQFCDTLLLTERDLVVTLPESATVPERGEPTRCSLFLTDDDNFVAHCNGTVHWELTVNGQQLLGLFLEERAPADLLDLTHDDRRREIRFPSNFACVVSDNRESSDGRLVNYSLNGLATQLPTPMSIGTRYTIEVESSDGPIQLDGICRWNIETSYGFVNGCSIRPGDGQRLASRSLQTARTPMQRLKPASSRKQKAKAKTRTRASRTGVGQAGKKRPLFTRATIVVLSAVLLGLSQQIPGGASNIALISGCLGIVAYMGLLMSARRRGDEPELGPSPSAASRAAAEQRLAAHVAGGRPTEPEPAEQDS